MYRISGWFVKVAAVVLLGLFTAAAAQGSKIEGRVYLEGEANHSGTRVEFHRYPLGKICYITFTDATGRFSKTLLSGCYDVIFSHAGFVTDGMAYVCVDPLEVVVLPPCTLSRVSCEELDWHRYPYYPPGTSIHFPADEGRHPPFSTYPVEWWYVNFHLVGESTGEEYGAFAGFFKVPPMRLFSISDLDEEKTYSNAKCISLMTAEQYYLDLWYQDEPLSPDFWRNMRHVEGTLDCDGDLMPFTYRLHVDALADHDGSPMELDVIMSSTKAPLIVGGDGFINAGNDSSYYYSHTKVKVLDDSEITVHGLTEKVSGYAWIDHQWGDFLLDQPLTWEWFSIKLDDLREIMVADAWEDGERVVRDSSQFNYFDSECSLRLSDEYAITTLDRWQDEVSGLWFATQWRIVEPSNEVDLIVTADYDEQVMRIFDPCDFPRACFWEGVCSVTGTIGGAPVSGKAYAELTHPSPPPCSCEYVGRCVDNMKLYWHEEDPPSYYYTEQTYEVRGGEGGLVSGQDRLWFLMNMVAEETRYYGDVGWFTQHYFGLLTCWDPGICDTLYTIRLPSFGPAQPSASYHGLAYNDNDGTFWYSRPLWPAIMPPVPPRTTLKHIDGSGNELGSFVLNGYGIVGLAFDADNNHLWCIARGDPDLLLEYDISTGEPILIQGPFEVPWSSPANSAAGLEYDELENAVVAIDRNTDYFLYFCDEDPNYAGPPGSGEPSVSFVESCSLSHDPWGVALAKGLETAFIAGSSGSTFPLDEYEALSGCPGQEPVPLPLKQVAEDEHHGLYSRSYPNPFNPAAEISYALPSECHVELSIFNILGQRVKTLVDEYQAAGHNTVNWNGTDKEGNRVASGVYFYQIKAGNLTETKKMILMK